MEVILDMAISLNGMVARKNGSEDWLPYEGWVEFIEEASRYDNIVMGRETYDKVTALYEDHGFDDVSVSQKIIITRNRDFIATEGYVVVHSPQEAIDYLRNKGFNKLYLIGGGLLNAEFMKQNLISDIQLTVNPYVLGEGRSFIAVGDFEAGLTLVSSKNLSNGRMRLVYKVNQSPKPVSAPKESNTRGYMAS